MSLVCAGRTDAGVHARGQVAHFDTGAQRSARSWVLGANSELPQDVSVSWAVPVPAHFHARYCAEARTYRYLHSESRRTLGAGRAARRLDLPAAGSRSHGARRAVALLGEHDFSAFRAAECQAKSPIRRMERLIVERRGDWVIIEATANAFLHHMVRNIAGLLIAIGKGEQPPQWAREVLQGRDRAPQRRHRACGRAVSAVGALSGGLRLPPGGGAGGAAGRSAMIGAAAFPLPRGAQPMSWFEKIMPSRIKTERRTRSVPEGLWIKCPACDAVLYRAELERNLYVCPKCSHHMRIGARERLERFLDPGNDRRDRRRHHLRRIR